MRNEYGGVCCCDGKCEWRLRMGTETGTGDCRLKIEGRRAIEWNLGGYKNKPAPPHVAWNRTEAAAAGTMVNILQCTAIKFGIPRRHTLQSELQL